MKPRPRAGLPGKVVLIDGVSLLVGHGAGHWIEQFAEKKPKMTSSPP